MPFADPTDWRADALRYAPAVAYCNRLFVVACNHAGDVADPGGLAAIPPTFGPCHLHRWPGYGFGISPGGVLLAESDVARGNVQNVVYADLDPAELDRYVGGEPPFRLVGELMIPLCARRWRQNSGDMLLQRRPETYRLGPKM